MTKQEKIEHCVDWIMHSDESTLRKALTDLVEFAIRADYISVTDPKDRKLLSEESGKPVSYYETPYFSSCGEPLGQ